MRNTNQAQQNTNARRGRDRSFIAAVVTASANFRAALPLVASGLSLLLAPRAFAQAVHWAYKGAVGPSPRYFHAMAYDSSRGVTVLFGGIHSDTNGETWEWNGSSWTQRIVDGPSPRHVHAMAYDSARGVTVLFGGARQVSGSNVYNVETWEWNGTTWTPRMVSGPSQRTGHAMAYDAARGVTVLFGGTLGVENSQTWEWNGTDWNLRSTSGPSPRYYHAMAYDAARSVTVLFGGTAGSRETWEWNGLVWNLRSTDGPTSRFSHAMAYDAARGFTVLFGGTDNGGASGSNDTWEWNGIEWTQRIIVGPTPRFRASAAYDAARGTTVVFGGFNQSSDNGETWTLGCTADVDDGSGTGTPDGGVTIDDLLYYLQRFEAGC